MRRGNAIRPIGRLTAAHPHHAIVCCSIHPMRRPAVDWVDEAPPPVTATRRPPRRLQSDIDPGDWQDYRCLDRDIDP
jgi:hypothetical protein